MDKDMDLDKGLDMDMDKKMSQRYWLFDYSNHLILVLLSLKRINPLMMYDDRALDKDKQVGDKEIEISNVGNFPWLLARHYRLTALPYSFHSCFGCFWSLVVGFQTFSHWFDVHSYFQHLTMWDKDNTILDMDKGIQAYMWDMDIEDRGTGR